MGLSAAVTLLCLLACTGNCVHRCKDTCLREIIYILNQVTKEGTPCTEMFVPDVLTATKNTTESELICRASRVLRRFYPPHEVSLCLKNSSSVFNELKKLFKAISGLSPLKSCTVNESKHTTLKDFLERLKSIMQEKYMQS